MIEIKNVSESYVKNKKVIDNISFKINDGEVFGFIGPNGAGKTTTIEMMTGVLDIDEGDILFDGKSIIKNPIECKKIFAYVPDTPDTFDKLTAIEYLNFIGDVYGVSAEKRLSIINNLAEEFNIQDSLESKIQSFSHGMKQKLLIISALMHNPKNWILDEPMTGLDPKAAFLLKKKMKEHAKKGNTVFFSTHVLEVAEEMCDRIAIIDKGQIKFTGTCEELKHKSKESKSLEEAFINLFEDTQKEKKD